MRSISYLFFCILILFKTEKINSQQIDVDSKEILKVILADVANNSPEASLYLMCSKPKTYFDKNNFINEAGVQYIPTSILAELEEKSAQSSPNNKWNKCLLKSIKSENVQFHFNLNKCIKEKDVDKARNPPAKKIKNIYNAEQVIIITLHNPILDKEKNYCVITVVRSFYIHGFTAQDFYLERKEGEWMIISKFNYVIS